MPVRAPRPRSVLRWSAVALLVALSSDARADGPRGAEWAAKDAMIYVEGTHPSILLDRLTDPQIQVRLAAIPQYEKFLKGDQFKQMKAGAQFVSAILETTWDEGLRKLAGGGVALVVEAKPGQKPWGFLAITPSDPAFLARAHAKILELTRNDAKAKGQPDPIKVSEHKGVTLYATKDHAYAIVRETLVIAPTVEALRPVVDRAQGGLKDPLTGDPLWKARHERASGDTLAWGLVRLDRLRQVDKKFIIQEPNNPGPTFVFGPWIDAFRKAPTAAAEVRWTGSHLAADLVLPGIARAGTDPNRKFLPPKGQGAPAPLKPRGTIASLGLWRDMSAVWEVRNELFPPQVIQGLAQLDTFAGQYFGGRDFGSGVLGAIGTDWRLVVAEQDYTKINPVPDLKLPAFALVIDLKPDDDDFAQRLKVAFQSFIGLANLGAAQSKAPPLELGSETVDGVTIATSRFMVPKAAPGAKEPVHQRQNYSPSAAQVDNHFILSSSLGLTKDLIPVLRGKVAPSTDATAVLEADGEALARLLATNRRRLITQNMLEKGNTTATATGQVDVLLGLLRYLGRGTLTAHDGESATEFTLDFALGTK